MICASRLPVVSCFKYGVFSSVFCLSVLKRSETVIVTESFFLNRYSRKPEFITKEPNCFPWGVNLADLKLQLSCHTVVFVIVAVKLKLVLIETIDLRLL